MESVRDIQAEVVTLIDAAITNRRNWLALNCQTILVGSKDVSFFSDADSARSYCAEQSQENHDYQVLYIQEREEAIYLMQHYQHSLAVDADLEAARERVSQSQNRSSL